MAENTSISWCNSTWNPIRGCSRISAGCDHCYAEAMSKRNPTTLGVWGPGGTRSFGVESYWRQPAKWNEKAAEVGEIHTVFCMSLADLFEGAHEQNENGDWTELREGPRPDYLPILERMVETFAPLTSLRVLALTKRTWNAVQWSEARGGWPANWWLGASVENQAAAEERIPYLLKVPAAIRFLSCEPLLGPVDLSGWMAPNSDLRPGHRWAECLCSQIDPSDRPCVVCDIRGIGWVIGGGESGPHARPWHPGWARLLRDRCTAAGVPFHWKQHGEWAPDCIHPDDTHATLGRKVCRTVARPTPGRMGVMFRCGKHNAGRILDGRTWDELPEAT